MYVLLVLNTQLKVLNVCNKVPNAIIVITRRCT